MAGKAGMEGRGKRLSGREMAGANCVQVKGRVALKSPLARFTPPGKAVRKKKVPPRETDTENRVACEEKRQKQREWSEVA